MSAAFRAQFTDLIPLEDLEDMSGTGDLPEGDLIPAFGRNESEMDIRVCER